MIVATVVLAIGITGSMYAFKATTSQIGAARDITTATLLAQQRLAELTAQPDQLTSGGDQQGEFDGANARFSWQSTTEQTNVTNIVRLTVTVSWQDGFTARRVQLSTYANTALTPSQTQTGTSAAGATTP
jgi:Tfp pilus assembly protein PilV